MCFKGSDLRDNLDTTEWKSNKEHVFEMLIEWRQHYWWFYCFVFLTIIDHFALFETH